MYLLVFSNLKPSYYNKKVRHFRNVMRPNKIPHAIISVKRSGGKMDKIFAAPTSTTQWQNLVIEASRACNITLPEQLESYLVFLLMRFITTPQMAHNVMGLEFLNSISYSGALRPIALRDVGDQCLLYSGLFPGRARRRRVRVSYYVNLGKSAYFSLAHNSKFSDSELFANLSDKFVLLMDTLQAMREINNQSQTLDAITAEELWHDTGSEHALQVLQQFTSQTCSPIINLDISSNKH